MSLKFMNFMSNCSPLDLTHILASGISLKTLEFEYNSIMYPEGPVTQADHNAVDTYGSDVHPADTSVRINLCNDTEINAIIAIEGLEEGQDYPEPLPEWADRLVNPNHIERMTQLLTRDGSVCGNAVIFDIVAVRYDHEDTNEFHMQFWVVTDARNVIKLTGSGLITLFHKPQYIMSDYPNNEDEETSSFLDNWYDRNVV